MKRLLVLNYEFPPLGGGASRVSYELAKRLSEAGGYDIDVVTMCYRGLPAYKEINTRLRVHRVWSWRSKKEICHPWEQLTYLISGFFKCRALLKEKAYDNCHAHFVVPTGILALLLKRQFDLSYIITSHGSDIPGYNMDRFVFLHKFTKPILRRVINNSAAAIAGSNYLARLADSRIRANKKYNVIREGFDAERFLPQKKHKFIFSSGRLLPRKGFQYLIKSVSDENTGYEVHIAGDGPMMPELQDLAKNSNTKIIFHGWLENTGLEYKNLLEQSSIYVLVSEKENASVALLEAMSAGCAVITSNESGCPETVGDTGITVTPRSVKELKRALQNVFNNENTYGDKARIRVINEFSWDNCIRRYQEYL